ncbi:MAG: signal recognition particle-docking protein FtsY [Thermodesulfovibrionales bacterium]|nr:signal recognition particle-docking protein FtsY [Thermodesulfovibrionales bacterium]
MGFFERLKSGIAKTKQNLIQKVENVFQQKRIDESSADEIEEILISADFGAQSATEIVELLKEKIRAGEIKTLDNLKAFLRQEMSRMLGHSQPIVFFGERPFVILTVGVNGAGKTTTIGKLASRFVSEGYSVLIGAADTFRAAAIEQLETWAKRAGADIIMHKSGSDPAAVAYDTVEAAKHRGIDVVIIDTAGRLQTKTPLMEELKKIHRVIKKSFNDAPQEILLVLDATTGQNAISQARLFNDAVGITGIALTKLDGTAKGGIVFAIKRELGIPVRLIGIGEGIDDLKDFNPEEFVKALFD